MPEGDTIFRAAATLHRALSGRAVKSFESMFPQLTRVDDDAPIAGRTIEKVSSIGKHLIIRFSGELHLRTHMKMNGSWHIYRPGEKWRKGRRDMRIVITTDEFVAVGFNIPVAEFLTRRDLSRQRDLRSIGPDLLSEDFDAVEAARRIQTRGSTPICEVLLNQRVVAGIGNVYKSEILFLCGVEPFTAAADVSPAQVQKILATGRKLMKANVTASSPVAIVTYSGFRRTTGRSDPGERLWVYGRGGKPCRKCGTAICRAKKGLDARSTYWCPVCQGIAGPARG